jgi:hypothetical protein
MKQSGFFGNNVYVADVIIFPTTPELFPQEKLRDVCMPLEAIFKNVLAFQMID